MVSVGTAFTMLIVTKEVSHADAGGHGGAAVKHRNPTKPSGGRTLTDREY